jgi:hypothetical protein
LKQIHATVPDVRKKKPNPVQIFLPFDLINAPEETELITLDTGAEAIYQTSTIRIKDILEIKDYCRRCVRKHKPEAKCPRRVLH